MAVPSAQQECAAAGCDDCRHCDNNGQGAVLRRRGFRLHGRGFPGGLWHSCIAGAGFLRWGLPGILVAGQLQAGFIAADVEAERRNAGDIVQAERHGEFFLRLHILSGDLDLQPRGFRRQGRHAQQQRRQGQKVFYFSHGLPPLIPIKWIMSACGHENLPGEIWDWVILYFSLIPPSDFP